VPWDQANRRHQLLLTLVDADGNPPLLGFDDEGNPAPLMLGQQFELGRPPGLPPGMDLDHTISANLGGGLDLTPGQMYEWRLEIDGHHDETWSAKFYVRDQ
jgi:hypothetical protein